jgi:multidrug efflux pump subunit AcrA (membrane-fusion protein)
VKRSIVYVLHPEKADADRVEVRTISPGFDDGTNTEIKSGLKKGESVVVAGLPRLGVRAPDSQSQGFSK